MDEFKDQIKDLYKAFSDKQKNTKGTPHKFDSIGNFRGKLGVNDTGIPLTPKAYKKKERNRSNYRYPIHLQNLNERRRKEAMARHGITDIEDPFNKKSKERRASQHAADRNVWNTRMPRGNFNIDTPRPPPRKYNYYGSYNEPEPEQVIYVAPPKAKKVTTYKLDGRFPKLDEAIRKYKK
tara:strand:+ start:4303 stop:4842 length:540 start_codon:yes stop_codon:yes gene_type:complete